MDSVLARGLASNQQRPCRVVPVRLPVDRHSAPPLGTARSVAEPCVRRGGLGRGDPSGVGRDRFSPGPKEK